MANASSTSLEEQKKKNQKNQKIKKKFLDKKKVTSTS
jgi:hypothetical protein